MMHFLILWNSLFASAAAVCHPLDGRRFKVWANGWDGGSLNEWISFHGDQHWLIARYDLKTDAMPLYFKAVPDHCGRYKLQNTWTGEQSDHKWVSFTDCRRWVEAAYNESNAMPIQFQDVGEGRYKLVNKWPGEDSYVSFTDGERFDCDYDPRDHCCEGCNPYPPRKPPVTWNGVDCETHPPKSLRAVYSEQNAMVVTLFEEPYSPVPPTPAPMPTCHRITQVGCLGAYGNECAPFHAVCVNRTCMCDPGYCAANVTQDGVVCSFRSTTTTTPAPTLVPEPTCHRITQVGCLGSYGNDCAPFHAVCVNSTCMCDPGYCAANVIQDGVMCSFRSATTTTEKPSYPDMIPV